MSARPGRRQGLLLAIGLALAAGGWWSWPSSSDQRSRDQAGSVVRPEQESSVVARVGRVSGWSESVIKPMESTGAEQAVVMHARSNHLAGEVFSSVREGTSAVSQPTMGKVFQTTPSGRWKDVVNEPRNESLAKPYRDVEPISHRGVRIKSAEASAFPFRPEDYSDGRMHFAVTSPDPVVVSVHGPGSATCRIDGQPMEEGRQYPLRDGTVLQADTKVGVHLRPAKDARLIQPAGNG